MTYQDWLAHFNPNHDPRNGQFAKDDSGSSSSDPSENKSDDYLRYKELRKRNVKTLTNEELKFIKDRNELISNYRTEGEKRTRAALSKLAKRVITTASILGAIKIGSSIVEASMMRVKQYEAPKKKGLFSRFRK